MKTLTYAQVVADLEARKAELGIVGTDYVARNPGGRRTESKKALLQLLRDKADADGEVPRFPANL
jgi:hypothetical protein